MALCFRAQTSKFPSITKAQQVKLIRTRMTEDVLIWGEECFGLQPRRLAADTAYGSGMMIGWLMRRRHRAACCLLFLQLVEALLHAVIPGAILDGAHPPPRACDLPWRADP